MKGSHHSSKLRFETVTVSSVWVGSARPDSGHQLDQVPIAGAVVAGFVVEIGIVDSGYAEEGTRRTSVPGVVPYAGRHDTVGLGHSGHLGQALNRILHEVDD